MSWPVAVPPIPAPASPCIKICTLDAEGVCAGCLRTIDEIARWGSMSAEQQWEVIAALEKRRQAATKSRSGTDNTDATKE